MKLFKVSFNFEADDTWVSEDIKDMIEVVLDPVYYSEAFSASELNVEEIEEEE